MKDELSFESSIKSLHGFDDPLLIALEKSGKTLTEIQMAVMPWGNEKSEESIIVNGQWFRNDEKSFNGRSQKKVRIREILDASFSAKEQANKKFRYAVDEKNRLAEENSAIERRYKYISQVAKREFGIGLLHRRQYRHDRQNSIISNDRKKAQKTFDCYTQSSEYTGDDEESFPAIVKKDPINQETKLERHALNVLDVKNLGRSAKRLNRPRPKATLIRKAAENPQRIMHTVELQIKEELVDSRMQLPTPSSSPESDIDSETDEPFEIVHPKLVLMDKAVKKEGSAINMHQKIYSNSDLGLEEEISDTPSDEMGIDKLLQHQKRICDENDME